MDAKTIKINWKRSRLKDRPSHVLSASTTQHASEAALFLAETVQVAATTSVPPFTIVAKLAREAIQMAELVQVSLHVVEPPFTTISNIMFQEYKRNRKKWTSFVVHVQQIVALVIASAMPHNSLEPFEENMWRMYRYV